MKIAIISDIHFGARRASEIILNSQIKFFKNQFIPDLKSRGIDTIIIPGDFFDNRLALDNKILKTILDLFDTDLKDFQIYILVGNHDSYLESSIHINSLRVFEMYENVKIFKKNESITLNNRKIYMCPWITNSKEFLTELESLEEHDICFGHFNFSNFLMFKDQEADHGISPELFYKKFKKTFSGHFHTRSSKKVGESEIIYVGNPFHLTRNDIDDERGYSILDLETLDVEFIENKESIKFVKYYYPEKLDKEHIFNNHVDLYVKYDENYDEKKVDEYLSRLESFEPAFPINKKSINMINGVEAVELKATSGRELIEEYVQQQTIENKQEILEILFKLFDNCKNTL